MRNRNATLVAGVGDIGMHPRSSGGRADACTLLRQQPDRPAQIRLLAKFLQEKQPDVQLLFYAQWQARRTGNWLADFSVLSEVDPQDWRRGYKEKTDPQFWLENVAGTAQKAGLPAKVERSLKNQYELTVQGLNARAPMKNPVKLIPVGHVMKLLYSKMRAGLVPGYSSPYEKGNSH